MIIRKPYAILIKNFKLIHTILLAIMFYLTYKIGMISKFFSDYFADNKTVIGQELTDELFNFLMYFSIFAIIVGLIIVLVLMVMKRKPIKYYIGGILSYLFIFIALTVASNTIGEMELELLSARTVRAVADIINISLVIQAVMIILTFVRATGFNIKQFDFEKDLQELNITEEDREEVEVGLNVDSGKFERKVRRQLRHMRYVYLENKLICNILIVIMILFIGYQVYTKSGMNEKIYKEGNDISTTNFIMNVENSYITDTDYKKNKLEQGKTLVVLQLKIKSKFITSQKLVTAKAVLKLKGNSYYPSRTYLQKMDDIGMVYDNQKISGEDTYYVLCYEVPSNYLNEKMIFQYIDSVSGIKNKLAMTYQKVKLSPIDLRKKTKAQEYKIGEEMKITNSIFNGLSLKINSAILQDEFKLSYNFCAVAGECYQSYEYIKPDILTNYDKTLLKLNLNYKLDNHYINSHYKDPYNFISKFATVEYVINNKKKTHPIALKKVTPKVAKTGNDLYIEVLKEVKNASNIDLVFKIRNQEYRYKIK